MQSSIRSSRFGSNPIMTSPHAAMTGTLLAPEISTIFLSASLSSATLYSEYLMPLAERNSFAVVQYGHVGVV